MCSGQGRLVKGRTRRYHRRADGQTYGQTSGQAGTGGAWGAVYWQGHSGAGFSALSCWLSRHWFWKGVSRIWERPTAAPRWRPRRLRCRHRRTGRRHWLRAPRRRLRHRTIRQLAPGFRSPTPAACCRVPRSRIWCRCQACRWRPTCWRRTCRRGPSFRTPHPTQRLRALSFLCQRRVIRCRGHWHGPLRRPPQGPRHRARWWPLPRRCRLRRHRCRRRRCP